MIGMANCFLLISVSGTQTSSESDQSQALRAKTELLQIIFSSFLNDNSYSIVKVIFLKIVQRKKNYGELFLRIEWSFQGVLSLLA